MPWTPKRPCTHPGCPALTETGRCEKHQKQEQKTYDRDRRDIEAKKFYNSKHWRVLRKAVRQRDGGLCQECRRKGRPRAGIEADHIVPRERGGTDAMENLEWLCRECHSRKSATEGSRWGGAHHISTTER